MVWNKRSVKLELFQNKITGVALGAQRYAGMEALRGDTGYSLITERKMKAVLSRCAWRK